MTNEQNVTLVALPSLQKIDAKQAAIVADGRHFNKV
jgi:hypothetical protein